MSEELLPEMTNPCPDCGDPVESRDVVNGFAYFFCAGCHTILRHVAITMIDDKAPITSRAATERIANAVDQQSYRDRQSAAGLVLFREWVHRDDKIALKRLAQALKLLRERHPAKGG